MLILDQAAEATKDSFLDLISTFTPSLQLFAASKGAAQQKDMRLQWPGHLPIVHPGLGP